MTKRPTTWLPAPAQNREYFIKKIDNDLYTDLTITLSDALMGFTAQIEHLDGHFVSIKETGVTQPNQERIIRGEGLPKHEYHSEMGDLIIVFKVNIPHSFSDSQKSLWKDFFRA